MKTLRKIISFLKYLLIGFVAFLGFKTATKIIKAVKGEVEHEKNFELDKDPKYIHLKKNGEKVKVKLPDGLTSDKVAMAGNGVGGEITVEVVHEKIDINSIPNANVNMSISSDD